MTVPARFQIVSLDGGDIKGLFAATTLAAIEKNLGGDVTRNFNLIAGTSTGGIIVLGLWPWTSSDPRSSSSTHVCTRAGAPVRYLAVFED